MKKYLLLLVILSVSISTCFAVPQGFDKPIERNNAPLGFNQYYKPNTIHGVKEKGQKGDHVLLHGRFIERKDSYTYIFSDKSKDIIEVTINDPKIVPSKDFYYMIWGTIDKSFLETSINIEFISSPYTEAP